MAVDRAEGRAGDWTPLPAERGPEAVRVTPFTDSFPPLREDGATHPGGALCGPQQRPTGPFLRRECSLSKGTAARRVARGTRHISVCGFTLPPRRLTGTPRVR